MDMADWMYSLWGWVKGVDGQTWAAWAQALGALLAIYITQRIASRETRQIRKEQERRKQEGVKATLVLIFRAEAVITGGTSLDPRPLLPPSLPSGAVLHSLNVIATRLEEFKFLDNPSPVLARASLSSGNAIRKALAVYQAAKDGKALSQDKLTAYAKELRDCGDRLMKIYGIKDEATP
jgi:hypothetical protein